ncbi:hypothetical protein CXG81DRAFT_17740 [Caulochytrium protostelioides]|uniref:F5/8 type C domain-containing protein n=1 Tax=Caulochytrium protostelioides TaxID=1555241 RepID=A0A4P9XB57_9FUNG|nr:hypothetical protein CXG81DRAFT_17740 [Caulochytrium protostelioides]|eukprot:RKP02602.1 hypothetical protein CXG81DRAFT_17740 [Caulochytrium protostelioides]
MLGTSRMAVVALSALALVAPSVLAKTKTEYINLAVNHQVLATASSYATAPLCKDNSCSPEHVLADDGDDHWTSTPTFDCSANHTEWVQLQWGQTIGARDIRTIRFRYTSANPAGASSLRVIPPSGSLDPGVAVSYNATDGWETYTFEPAASLVSTVLTFSALKPNEQNACFVSVNNFEVIEAITTEVKGTSAGAIVGYVLAALVPLALAWLVFRVVQRRRLREHRRRLFRRHFEAQMNRKENMALADQAATPDEA